MPRRTISIQKGATTHGPARSVTPTGSPSNDGPWQSLSRLATASLLPGDVVELQCGSKWLQTLRIKNSGTPDHPITIRPASSACDAKPSIDGGYTIEAREWVPHADDVYKVSWPPQKIQGPTFHRTRCLVFLVRVRGPETYTRDKLPRLIKLRGIPYQQEPGRQHRQSVTTFEWRVVCHTVGGFPYLFRWEPKQK